MITARHVSIGRMRFGTDAIISVRNTPVSGTNSVLGMCGRWTTVNAVEMRTRVRFSLWAPRTAGRIGTMLTQGRFERGSRIL
jgi:hypothetical protein